MKPNIRWQLLLAAVCLGLILSLLSFQVQTAGLCSVRVPASGGTIAEGILGAPRFINPLLADSNPVDRELASLIFDGLTRLDADGRLQPALARQWQFSPDARNVRFELRPDARWADGRPVTAADVAFTYGLMQDPAFPGPAALNVLWSTVTITVEDEQTVVFTLPEPYAPFLEATTRGLLPAHALEGVTAATLAEHPFNQAPFGTGPFLVNPATLWTRSGLLRLLPNPEQWRTPPQLEALAFYFYPNAEAMLSAYEAGDVQAINRVPPSMLPVVAAQPETRLFSAPINRYSQLLFNLTESGAPALQSGAVRQALAYGLDLDRLIDQALNGQGVPLTGPYLPSSWAYNPNAQSLFPSSVLTASALLDDAGWLTVDGEPARRRDEASLVLRLLTGDTPRQQAVAAAIATQWAASGVVLEVTAVSPTDLITRLAEREFDVALVDVTPPTDPDLYDFWSQEAIVRGQNFAGWNNRRASEALENGRQIADTNLRRPYYENFLRHFNADIPALTLYQHIATYALHDSVNEAEINRIDHPREKYETFGNWFLLYREVTVSCPSPEA